MADFDLEAARLDARRIGHDVLERACDEIERLRERVAKLEVDLENAREEADGLRHELDSHRWSREDDALSGG